MIFGAYKDALAARSTALDLNECEIRVARAGVVGRL
jgi:hypothetical protein